MIAYVARFVHGAMRVISLGHAVSDTREVCYDQKLGTREKVVRCTSNSIYIFAEAGALGAWKCDCAPNARLQWESSASLTDIGRRGVQLAYKPNCTRDDRLDLAGFAALRVSGALDQAVLLQPATFGGLQPVSDGLGAVGNVILGRRALKRLPDCGRRAAAALAKVPSKMKKAIQTLTIYFQGKRTAGMEIKLSEEGAAELKIDSRYMREFLEVRDAPNIQAFARIPKILRGEPELLKCSITREPIRYPLVVRGTRGTETPLCYEKDAVLTSLSQNQIPPNWPNGLPFARENLEEYPELQKKIDDYLQECISNFQEFDVVEEGPIGMERLPFYDLAESLEIHNPAIADSRIRESISRTIPSNTYSAISVSTLESYKFPDQELPQKVRQITLKPRCCDSLRLCGQRPAPSIDVSRAVSAAFGSEDLEDASHLLAAYRRHSTLRVYLSMGSLENIHCELVQPQRLCVIL